MADAYLVVSQKGEDAQPRFVGQRLEQVLQLVDGCPGFRGRCALHIVVLTNLASCREQDSKRLISEPTRIYRAADAEQFRHEAGLSDEASLAQVDGRIMSAFIRATKPLAATKTCCGPTCCS